MERYIGIDVHLESCTFAVMGRSGRRLKEQVVQTDARAIRQFVKAVGGERHVCFEEGELSDWIYEILEPLVQEIVVVQPEKKEGVKSDAHDAWARADSLRVRPMSMRQVFKAPGKLTGLREAVHAQLTATQDVVRAKNRLQATYRRRGIQPRAVEIYDKERRQVWLEQLPQHQRRLAKMFSEQLDALMVTAEEANAWLREEAARCAAVRLISTAPGIKHVRASQVVARVITPHRFRTKRQFWSYCGLGVVTRSSSNWKWKNGRRVWQHKKVLPRGLNRNRSPLLKGVFNGAAKTVTRQMLTHPLARNYQRLIEAGTEPNNARLTVARQLAAAVLAMWKKQEVYDPAKHMTDITE
jgi:transposase